MAEYTSFGDWLSSIANAIRSKKGTTDKIVPINFANEIESIEVGGSETIEYRKVKAKPQTDGGVFMYNTVNEDGTVGAGCFAMISGITATTNVPIGGYFCCSGNTTLPIVTFTIEGTGTMKEVTSLNSSNAKAYCVLYQLVIEE